MTLRPSQLETLRLIAQSSPYPCRLWELVRALDRTERLVLRRIYRLEDLGLVAKEFDPQASWSVLGYRLSSQGRKMLDG